MGDNQNPVHIEQSLLEIVKEADTENLIDRRKASWVKHKSSLILAMILIGLLHQRLSIRSIARLYHNPATAQQMWDLFEPFFGEELRENGFPSYSCIDRFLQAADTEALGVYLSQWGYQLIDDDGFRQLNWGVDGQAAKGSRLKKEGGRPQYNVDYYDCDSNILVYLCHVESKSQESVVTKDTVQEVLSGHPNVVLGADAMMTKKDILDEAQSVGAKTYMPVKRNNPILMNGFTKTVEDKTLEGSPAVEHYVDLNGMPDGVGSEIIRDTLCTYEEEDNKKYDSDLRSRPIRELVFFDNVYPYVKESDANATSLCIDSETTGKWMKIGDRYMVLGPGHGRLERREYDYITDPQTCDIWENVPVALKREWQPYASTICVATRYRAEPDMVEEGKGKDKIKRVIWKVSVTRTVYAFSFADGSIEDTASLIRGYWNIEGKLHNVVDKALGQDACTCRVGNSTGNMSLLRKTVYNALSGVKNMVNKITHKDVSYAEILETLSKRSDLACSLFFEKPKQSFGKYIRNCYPCKLKVR